MADDLSENSSEVSTEEKKSAKPKARKTTRTRRTTRTKRTTASDQADLPLESPSAKSDSPPPSGAEERGAAPPEPRREPKEAGPEDTAGGEKPSSDASEPKGAEKQDSDENKGDASKGNAPEPDGRSRDFDGRSQGGGQGNFGFRKKFKKDKHRNKHFQQGQGQGGPKWKQPAPPSDGPPIAALPDPSRYVDLEAMAAKAAEIAGEGDPLYLDEFATATHAVLLAANHEREIPVVDNPGRVKLIENLIKWATENKRPIVDRGHLDVSSEDYGFVVHQSANYRLLPESTYVPAAFIRKHGLRRGLAIEVQVEPAAEGERCPVALVIQSAMGGSVEDAAKVVPFEDLVPYYPTARIHLEVPSTEAPSKVDVSMRCVDILTPIGFGQRGLIVAPPRTGKTIILQALANSVATNFPKAKLIVLLVDERPEEVTDFRRRVRGEVISSTFDETPESHVHAAEMVGEKARRLVERGEDVVILLDSITRLARAYNALTSNSGKIMSGGIEATALQKPKRFFGAARNIEGGGSLTIIGSALIDTNSRMDDVIFEEFKGTGNMELHLDRDLVNKRIFPAINFERSGTRKEELLYHPEELQKIYGLRRIMLGVPAHEAMEMLIQRLKKTRSNAEFLLSLAR